MATDVNHRAKVSPATLVTVQLVGYAAFFVQVIFLLAAKGGSWWELALWATGCVICIAGVAAYACIGRLILPGTDRAALRPAFRPYILGGAVFAAVLLLQAAALLTLGT
jgi:hypothetical protein